MIAHVCWFLFLVLLLLEISHLSLDSPFFFGIFDCFLLKKKGIAKSLVCMYIKSLLCDVPMCILG